MLGCGMPIASFKGLDSSPACGRNRRTRLRKSRNARNRKRQLGEQGEDPSTRFWPEKELQVRASCWAAGLALLVRAGV